MSVDIGVYRARVGLYYYNARSKQMVDVTCLFMYMFCHFWGSRGITIILFLLLISGNVHLNPGPTATQNVAHTSIVHINVSGLEAKLDLVETELCNYDVIAISETHLNPNISNDKILIKGYKEPYRKDRLTNNWGGVAVYVKNNIISKHRTDMDIRGLEAIWVEINNANNKLLIGTFYRAPSCGVVSWDLIEESFYCGIDDGIEKVIMVGDFNANVLEGNNQRIDYLCNRFQLSQLINKPTRITETTKSTLDLIFVSSSRYVANVDVLTPFCSDHSPVFVNFGTKENKRQKSFHRTILDYSNADIIGLKTFFNNFDWDNIFNKECIDTIVEDFSTLVLSVAKSFIPSKDVIIRPNDKPFMNGHIRKLIRQRYRLHNKAKHTNIPEDWANFRKSRNLVISEVRKAKLDYFKKLDNKINNSATLGEKDWWKLVNTYLKGRCSTSSTATPLLVNDCVVNNPTDIANAFNDFFITQSTLDNLPSEVPEIDALSNVTLDHIELNTKEVEDILKSLNPAKSTGPDLISNMLLKMLASELSYPLTRLFNLSIQRSYFPSNWKLANVIPIHKKGSVHDISNYRPISILSNLSKVFEKSIFKHVFNFVKDNSILTKFQSGFIPGDSTVNQLLDMYNFICQALDEGKEVRAVFCDISKAFDRVWHKGMVAKLKSIGISGNLLYWFENYLSHRKQRVVIEGKCSSTKIIPAGVPQGSVLGPMLFLIYINDIVNGIDSNIRLFADDTSLLTKVDDPQAASNILNSDLKRINNWAKRWLVKFSPAKTKTLTFTRKSSPLIKPTLYLNNEEIIEVNCHKHLGLVFQQSGEWRLHVQTVIDKTSKMTSCLRSFKYRLSRKSLEKIYNTFILPLFDYADVIWDNCTLYLSQQLENIQLDALRTICGAVRGTSHQSLYKETGFVPLSERRKCHKLCMMYRICKDMTPAYLSQKLPKTVSEYSRYPLRDADHLQGFRTRTKLFSNSFFPSGVKLWNKLHINTRNSLSISCFKKHLYANKTKTPFYFYTCERRPEILHCRLRLNISDLNGHKFTRFISDIPMCACGHPIENSEHFLLHCPNYDRERAKYLFAYSSLNYKVLLFGNPNFENAKNIDMFKMVQKFIVSSKRFDVT